MGRASRNSASDGGSGKKKNRAVLIVVLLLIAVIGAGFGVYKIHGIRAEKKAKELARIEAEKEAEKEAERKAAEEAEKKKKAEESKEWYLLLVNPWNRMPDDFEIETADVEKGYVIDSRVRDALSQMLADCRAAGYSPQIISTFRTRETQQYLYDHTANKDDTAYPGTSEHECGLAADIIDSGSAGWSDPLIKKQEDMPAQKWLMEHCQDYGFILRYPEDKEDITGIIYEPWHYRYVGKEHAANIMKSGVCLEEYLQNEFGVENVTGSPEEKIGR